MIVIFDGMLLRTVELYADNIFVKTKERENNLHDLKQDFERLITSSLKMDLLKCAFGVTFRKFLGFAIRYKGIEVDPYKIKVITEMPPPHNLQQLCGLQG